METNTKIHTCVATLLLIAATLASSKHPYMDEKYLIKSTDYTIISNTRTIEASMSDGDTYSPEPGDMLQELKAELNSINPEEPYGVLRGYCTKHLVSFAELDQADACNGISVQEYLTYTSMRHRKFER